MKDSELNNKLDAFQAPAPSDLLKSRILKAAKPVENTSPKRQSYTQRFMPIAASLLAICAVSFGVMQVQAPTEPDSAAWQEAALDLGFEEVYDWVETEESSSQ
ncbi:hypothetical protein [Hellea balneolensis]|uniref:hypothetical protein n=1 Tax=Hellea balneolensis TaxID=287478 RepID=UPI0012B92A82|nr:hypothetical protein [Hellea balneolensis]